MKNRFEEHKEIILELQRLAKVVGQVFVVDPKKLANIRTKKELEEFKKSLPK